jgi:C4-dicarboxylate transporter DctQ subunit
VAHPWIDDLGRWLDRLERLVIVLCCAGIVVLIFSGVVSRFALHYAIAWSEELARFLFLWGALFGAAAACRTGQHGGIPLIVDHLSPTWQRRVEVLVGLGVTLFLGYLAWQSLGTTIRAFGSGQTSTTTHIPIWVVNLGMMLAFLLAVLRSIQGFLTGAYRPSAAHVE